jgi:hypothetical protein
MKLNIPKELATLQRLTTLQLRAKYAEVFGETTTTGNRSWLLRRIAWAHPGERGGRPFRARPQASRGSGQQCRPAFPPHQS